MRIAQVSPYSWTLPGGVTRHIDELSQELEAQGHEVVILAPVDPDDRLTQVLHRRRPEAPPSHHNLVPLGRTVGLPANGAVSNLSMSPKAVARLRHELRHGRFDVIHVHEPIAPVVGWDAAYFGDTPTVGTFHAYSSKWLPNACATVVGARRIFNRLHRRIAVSEAARWTGERYFGGRYEVIPNGVDMGAAPNGPKTTADHLRILFVGREEDRKGLPVLLAAFAGLLQHVPARLQVVGAKPEGVEPLLAQMTTGLDRIEVHGRVDDGELWRHLHDADVLCAPSLGGESFGMVLIESFAAGTPVIASDIAGYRDVVCDGHDGLLVPRGQPLELAEALRSLWLDPDRRRHMGAAARERAADFAWPRVAEEVVNVYRGALESPAPSSSGERIGVRLGLRPADMSARRPPVHRASLEPAPPQRTVRARLGSAARRGALGLSALLGVGLALIALKRVGAEAAVSTLLHSSPSWVMVALALFSASMVLRAVSWYAIVKAALPGRRVKRRVILSGTFIGVLMSATLPARLGEPSRALIVARRLGRMRETLPVLVGTLVSQTFLNMIALGLLAVIVASSSSLFHDHEGALIAFSLVPVALIAALVVSPMILRPDRRIASRDGAFGRIFRAATAAVLRLRTGLAVFRRLRLAAWAASAQLAAWALQLLGAFALLLALNLDSRVGLGAAAAVLFAVNVTAVLPATPSNVGVFQLAVITVLSGVYGVSAASALGYGIILQAVEVATAVVFGLPALIGEGLSWRDVRMRALAAAPVELSPSRSPQAELRT
jgi:phosphatidylinositol alpha-mannosyltransferase